MSPEQALGKPVDARADVFAFGALLYEMAAGKPAFLGTTVQETLSKVLHSEPEPLAKLRRDLPMDFVAIVNKALRKDPAERYQTMAELAADLRHFKRTTDSGVVPPASADNWPSGKQRAWRMVGIVVLVAIVAALARDFLGFGGGGGSRDALPRFTNPRQITSAIGWENNPSWSGQGGLLAYQARSGVSGAGKLDIWVTQAGSGTPVNRTSDLPGACLQPSLSPDGTTIVFSVLGDANAVPPVPWGVYTMPALGGPARLLIPRTWARGQMEWSTDGKRMAYVAQDADQSWVVRIVTSSGEALRDIPLPEDVVRARADLAWSRDERLFAYQVTADPRSSDTSRLWLFREEDGAAYPLTDGLTLAQSPNFAPDGRALYYVSNQGGSMDLWRQALAGDGAPEGEPVAMTAGLGIGRAAFSPDGKRLAYSKGGAISNLWRVPYRPEGTVTWSDARQVTYDEALIEFADLSPDGTELAITTDRSGNDDIWIMPAEGGPMRQLTTDPSPDWFARWSPDGEQMLFYGFRSGNRDLWMKPTAGGPARQLTVDPETDWFGKWSPDGSRIAWVHWSDTGPVMKISAVEPWDPKDAIVAAPPFGIPTAGSVWVDDESFLLSVGPDFALVRDDGEVLHVYEDSGPTTNCVKVRGARTVLFDRDKQITALDLDTGAVRALSDFSDRPGRLGFPEAADGEQIWFGWYEERGDLWVMDVEPAE
jgi:Tol biopolymer transport system component